MAEWRNSPHFTRNDTAHECDMEDFLQACDEVAAGNDPTTVAEIRGWAGAQFRPYIISQIDRADSEERAGYLRKALGAYRAGVFNRVDMECAERRWWLHRFDDEPTQRTTSSARKSEDTMVDEANQRRAAELNAKRRG